jgi:transketolase
MQARPDLVVLDADLAADCCLRGIERRFPERFIENGIAEQDMVSMAGGLARAGLLPVVNSFAAFLAARANEQIYSNNTERTKIIYALHYSGLLPAGPGHSHQSVRDVALLACLPEMVIFQPCNEQETALGLDYLVHSESRSSALRLYLGASPGPLRLPEAYRVRPGRGVVLRPGQDATLLAYGPVLLWECLQAAALLEGEGLGVRVVNMPWLNLVDPDWLAELTGAGGLLAVVEDHAPTGGLAPALLMEMHRAGRPADVRVIQLAVRGIPVCGRPGEALQSHGLDASSIAAAIRDASS